MAFEVKLTGTPRSSDLDSLGTKATLIGATGHFLISRIREPVITPSRGSLNLLSCLDFVSKL